MARAKRNTGNYFPSEIVENKIYVVRGHKVMLDYDLAALYEVETKALNQAVKRNIDRFPGEFMFRLTVAEWRDMRSQFVTSYPQSNDNQSGVENILIDTSQKKRKKGLLPLAFTEHGVTMAASVLKSERAVKMSIAIVRTFIQLRKQIPDYTTLAEQIKEIKSKVGEHDIQLNQIYDAIETLLNKKSEEETWQNRKRIGFK